MLYSMTLERWQTYTLNMFLWEYLNLKGIITVFITMTKYSNITVVIILQEEGQDGEKKMEMQ